MGTEIKGKDDREDSDSYLEVTSGSISTTASSTMSNVISEFITEQCWSCKERSGEKRTATHYCRDCEPRERYICHECLQDHNVWLKRHVNVVKQLSVGQKSHEGLGSNKLGREQGSGAQKMTLGAWLLERRLENTRSVPKQVPSTTTNNQRPLVPNENTYSFVYRNYNERPSTDVYASRRRNIDPQPFSQPRQFIYQRVIPTQMDHEKAYLQEIQTSRASRSRPIQVQADRHLDYSRPTRVFSADSYINRYMPADRQSVHSQPTPGFSAHSNSSMRTDRHYQRSAYSQPAQGFSNNRSNKRGKTANQLVHNIQKKRTFFL